jgi:hypothetical protein
MKPKNKIGILWQRCWRNPIFYGYFQRFWRSSQQFAIYLGYIHKKISQELKENKRVQKDFSFL